MVHAFYGMDATRMPGPWRGERHRNELHFELQRRLRRKSDERAIVRHPEHAIPDKRLNEPETQQQREAKNWMLDIASHRPAFSLYNLREFEALRDNKMDPFGTCYVLIARDDRIVCSKFLGDPCMSTGPR